MLVSRHPLLWIGILLATSVLDARAAAQDEAERPEDRTPSYEVAQAARDFVGRFERQELFDDDTFIRTLRELARSDLPPEAKADAFILMQERLGWLFAGAARLFPNQGYAQTAAAMLSTYIQYQEAMPKDLDVEPLLDLAKTARADHPFRSSNALLLATILNHEQAKPAVREAIDFEAIQAAPVPPIDLHNLAFAAALTRDDGIVLELLGLLPKIPGEENREDVIVATVIYREFQPLQHALREFVKREIPNQYDRSIQTALIVLAFTEPQDEFTEFCQSLREIVDDATRQRLIDLWDSGFQEDLAQAQEGRQALKLWDGFTFELKEREGSWIRYGDSFRHWIRLQ